MILLHYGIGNLITILITFCRHGCHDNLRENKFTSPADSKPPHESVERQDHVTSPPTAARVTGPVAGVKEASETSPSLAEKLSQDSQLARTEAEGVGTMLWCD